MADVGDIAGAPPPERVVTVEPGLSAEELYRAVLNGFPDVTVFTFDRQMRFTMVAGGGFSRMGWSEREIIGQRPSDVMGPAGAQVEEHMGAALEGETRRVEIPGLHDDDVVWANTVAPLWGGSGQVVGGILISRDIGPIRQAEAQQRFMEEAATAAARLADFERRQRERLEFLAEINGVLADCEDRRDIMRAVTRAAVPRLGAWCTAYVFLDPHRTEPAVELAHVDPAMEEYARQLQDRFPYDPDARLGVAQVIRTGRPTLFEEINDQTMAELGVSEETKSVVHRLGLRSVVIVPLVKKHQAIGALEFFATGEHRYGVDDLTLAQAMAGRVASALDNRRLADQQREIARTLQRSLLPDTLPEIPGVELGVRYWAAGEGAEVGGDFYDVFRVDDRTHALAIGDVCGSGADAAAITALARHTIRANAWRGDDPAAVLTNLNSAMLRTRPGTFCTVAYVTLRAEAGGIKAALGVGGHPLPVCVRADGRVEHLGSTGLLLGVFEPISHPVEQVDLSPGDTLVLYTDGATDLPPPYGLSPEELAEMIRESAVGARDADAVAERLSSGLAARRAFSDRDDDVALVVARVRSAPRMGERS